MPTLVPTTKQPPGGMHEFRQKARSDYWSGATLTADQQTVINTMVFGAVYAAPTPEGAWYVQTKAGYAPTTKADLDAWVAALSASSSTPAAPYPTVADLDLVIRRADWLSVWVTRSLPSIFTPTTGNALTDERSQALYMYCGATSQSSGWSRTAHRYVKAALDAIGVPATV